MIEKLTILEAEGTKWVGILKEEGENVILEKAFKCKKTTEDTFIGWIKANNLDELSTVTFKGERTFVETTMTKESRILLRRLWEDMEAIKRTAIARLENSYFKSKG